MNDIRSNDFHLFAFTHWSQIRMQQDRGAC